MQPIAIVARRDMHHMVQLTILLLTNPIGYAAVHSWLVRVSMLIARLTDLVSRQSNSFGCFVNSTVTVFCCAFRTCG